MLINLSNHPLKHWSLKQIAAAKAQFGEVADLPFPDVNPEGDEQYIMTIVTDYLEKLLTFPKFAAVHIMGEMNFTYAMVNALKRRGINCVASTTERVATENKGVKTSEFRFVRFRQYS
ncbi:MAG: CRISPR-associated protein [Prevotellaceae bacterium]|jgi:NAD(P)H-flavin reductase|nr:CRISPR-associated protein [Prevotellaceae bacterium]